MTRLQTETFTIESHWIPIGSIQYQARLHYPDTLRPDRAAIIAPPHPFLGGNFDNNVVASVARALVQSGFLVLTYNLPGVGKSSPRALATASREDFWQSNVSGKELPHDAEDFLLLRDYLLDLAQLEPACFRAVGYSYGGAILWQAAVMEPMEAYVLVSPPESLLNPMRDGVPAGHGLCLFAEHDLAFGDKGLVAAEGIARPGLEVNIVNGADHFFRDHLDRVGEAVLQHFQSV